MLKVFDDPNFIIAFSAFMVSLFGIGLSIRTLRIQRRHNYVSLMPIGQIVLGDYEDEIFVKISNAGVGPLIINSVEVYNSKISRSNLIDFLDVDMPRGLTWSDFVKELANKAIRVDEDMYLARVESLDYSEDKSTNYDDFKKSTRATLGGLTILVKYSDVYGKNHFEVSRTLNWFNRTLD
ncbi:hypothetical protein BZG02_12775 [Labilibaculum filiforme]|uniref:Uncharacterized protein n=1 Tax=Labilibaculum filiforme TaxID=1940526 RepID=A0A2N3HWY2_9BACT|nr:hypothetical protein [Labilibaculum filiforme]PKQ62585.1 hypothetical protein BZG02_12775 [Labilibaculum filiforme]